MKTILIAICLLGLTACTSGTGSFKGKVIDVSWEGVLFKTCEVDVQYGDSSSKIGRFSSAEKSYCDNLEKQTGKSVELKYDHTWLRCITCGSDDLIVGVKVD